MAKNKSPIFDFQGTLGNVVFVNGPKRKYLRVPKGTYKPIPESIALTNQNSRNSIVNAAAKPLNDFLKEQVPDFKKSDLWGDMLKRIRSCKEDNYALLLQTLQGLEVNPAYALRNITRAQLQVLHADGTITLKLIDDVIAPKFKMKEADGYCYVTHVLFIRDNKKTIDVMHVQGQVYPLKERFVSSEISFPVPAEAKYYLALLEIRACIANEPTILFGGRGMAVMKAGGL
jgi:hypothetical protein